MDIKKMQNEASELVIKKNRRIADVAREYGVSPSTLRRWMDRYTDEQRPTR